MVWRVVERKIGRAGGVKQRTARQREWDQKYGEGNWAVGYVIDGTLVRQEDALESIYKSPCSRESGSSSHEAELRLGLGGVRG